MQKGKKTILIVEDDRHNREAMQLLLKNKFSIETCDSEKPFNKIISSRKIDLVIMDISLNGNKSGLDLTRELRENPDYKDIPIICLTAHARKTDEKNAMEAGANVFITKPVKNEKLLDLRVTAVCDLFSPERMCVPRRSPTSRSEPCCEST